MMMGRGEMNGHGGSTWCRNQMTGLKRTKTIIVALDKTNKGNCCL